MHTQFTRLFDWLTDAHSACFQSHHKVVKTRQTQTEGDLMAILSPIDAHTSVRLLATFALHLLSPLKLDESYYEESFALLVIQILSVFLTRNLHLASV